MNLKTYNAPTMALALAEVKKDLGKDAVILHTRVYRVGGVLGVGGRQVVEITASDQPPARAPRRAGDGSRQKPLEASSFVPASFERFELKPAAAATSIPAPASIPEHPVRPGAAPTPRAAESPDRAVTSPSPKPERSEKPAATPPSPLRTPLPTTRVAAAPIDPDALAALAGEMATIKRLVGHVLSAARRGNAGDATLGMSEPLFDMHLRLTESGVDVPLADSIVGSVRDELHSSELEDIAVVTRCVERALAAKLPVVGAVTRASREQRGRPLVLAFVGPTGVGKTTTVAKLAAAYKLRHGVRVGLITSDTYRIGAVDQLRTYAQIIGVPLMVALSARETEQACQRLSDCDVILMDTAGRSPRDASKLDELATFVQAASPDETHLVLSAAADQQVMTKAAEKFAALSPDRLIISKLDEALDFGRLANVVHAARLPLSYVTTGQEVPDHIELANADRFARLILGGTLEQPEAARTEASAI
ncbi:MAG: flagellar biosynthesis protein FlhF [Phycisphaerales bacterium]|jgi:flagellar biosynthesis protein FlhF